MKSNKFAKVIVPLLAFGILASSNACSTNTLVGRWATYRGGFNDAQYLPYLTVANDESNINALQTRLAGKFSKLLSEFVIDESSFEDYFFDRGTNSMVILHRGDIVFERYANGFERDSIQPSYSVSKSIVSMLLDIAHADRLISSTDDPLSMYLNNIPEKLGNLKIEHCQNMVSGIGLNKPELAGLPMPWNDEVRDYYHPNVRSLVKKMLIANEPDTTFTYQNYNLVLLGMLLEQVTGTNLASYASEKLWRPLGMEYPAQWSIDSHKHKFAKPGSGFNATAVDLARIGYAVSNRSDIVPDSTMDNATNPCCAQPDWSAPAEADIQDPGFIQHLNAIRYSDGWWGVETRERYDFYANGHLGQFIYISPAADLVVVRLGSDHGGSDDAEFGYHFYRLASNVIKAFPDES